MFLELGVSNDFLYRVAYPFVIAQPEGTPGPSTLGNHSTTVTPPSAHGDPSVASEIVLGVQPALADTTTTSPQAAAPCPLSITVETNRARLLFCTLLDENPTFSTEHFKAYARMWPGEAAAVLVAMAQGDLKTRQAMTTLLANLYRADKSAAINVSRLILRPSYGSEENFSILRQPSAATYYVGSPSHGVRQVVDLGEYYGHFC